MAAPLNEVVLAGFGLDADVMAEIRRLAASDQWKASKSSRRLRERRRRTAALISDTKYLHQCGRTVAGLHGHAAMSGEVVDDVPRSGTTGVYRCKRLQLCAWCAGLGREKRAEKVADAAGRWCRAGGFLAFATFTIQRRRGEPVDESTAAFAKVMERFGRLFRESGFRDLAGVAGDVHSWEWTMDRSLDGSGHPHMMRLYLFRNVETVGEWGFRLNRLWQRAALELGRYADAEIGVRVDHPGADEDGVLRVLSDYFSKGAEGWGAGRELTRTDLKSARDAAGGLAPFELLDVVRDGGEGSHAWRCYEKASKGKAVARFSRGLLAAVAELEAGVVVDGGEVLDDEVDDAADQVAQEEEEMLDEKVGGEVRVGFDPIALRFIHDECLMALVHEVVEEAMLAERDIGAPIDASVWVRDLLRGFGASRDVLFGVLAPAETTGCGRRRGDE